MAHHHENPLLEVKPIVSLLCRDLAYQSKRFSKEWVRHFLQPCWRSLGSDKLKLPIQKKYVLAPKTDGILEPNLRDCLVKHLRFTVKGTDAPRDWSFIEILFVCLFSPLFFKKTDSSPCPTSQPQFPLLHSSQLPRHHSFPPERTEQCSHLFYS